MRQRRLLAAVLAAMLLLPAVAALPAAAAATTDVVLTGLANPRGAHAVGGVVHIAEAGVGGDDPGRCYEVEEGFEVCVDETGQIRSYEPATDTDTVTVPDLPSMDNTPDASNPENGFFATGPHDVWVHEGVTYFVTGLGAEASVRDALADDNGEPAFEAFGKLWRSNGATEEVADIATYEESNNVDDGEGTDSNPYSVVVEGDTSALVADAGGNAVLRVDTTDGSIEPVAVLPPVLAPIPAFFGEFGVFPAEAVPTSLFPLSGGRHAVGQLTGFPFPVGGANVWELDNGDIDPLVEGFTNIIDVTQHPNGDLYVLQITEGSLLDAEAAEAPDLTGALYRVDLDTGDRELLLTDPLWAPGGMAFVGDDLYVTNCSVCAPTDDESGGHLLKIVDAANAAAIITVSNDTAETVEDEPVEIDVLDNDDGTGLEITYMFAENGSVWEGSVMYQPAAHFRGTDTIRYQVCDDAGNCATGLVKVEVEETETDRLNGADRIGTAVEVSRALFPYGAGTVVIARMDAYPDALAGSVLAANHGAPILLTRSNELDPATEAEINRLGATGAILLGGDVALSPSVRQAILDRTGVADVQRVAGKDRFETAGKIKAAIEEQTGEDATSVFIAEGFDTDPTRGFPDVLSVSALAAHTTRPILLVTTETLPGPTATALGNVTAATIVGGPVAVSQTVEEAVEAEVGAQAERLAGADRYATSAVVVKQAVAAGLNPMLLFLATGQNWPDALVAGPAVALDGGVLMLVHPTDLDASPTTVTFLEDNAPFDDVDLLGGIAAITQAVEDQIRGVLGG